MIQRFTILLTITFLLTASKPTTEIRAELKKFFDELKVSGSFVAFDLKKNKYIYFNPKRCKVRYTPASTFKIFNSLAAIESGAVNDEHFTLKWDGKDKHNFLWNRDTDMKEAFKNSTVWYYQEMARRVGAEKMKSYIQKVKYGNMDISGRIDEFWLTGGLKVSQVEQLNFLIKLYKNELPFSNTSMDVVKRIMVMEETAEYTLRGKTGWGVIGEMNIGWFVGYIEKGEDVYFFATNFETPYEDIYTLTEGRIVITKSILEELKML